jgi:hypothetical protein
VLGRLLVAIACSAYLPLFEQPDASGATATLALLVANTPEALDTSLEIYRACPTLLVQTHLTGIFFGESAFHVVATNRREDTLCAMLQLAHDGLSAAQLEVALLTQATGSFFRDEPMALYGGAHGDWRRARAASNSATARVTFATYRERSRCGSPVPIRRHSARLRCGLWAAPRAGPHVFARCALAQDARAPRRQLAALSVRAHRLLAAPRLRRQRQRAHVYARAHTARSRRDCVARCARPTAAALCPCERATTYVGAHVVDRAVACWRASFVGALSVWSDDFLCELPGLQMLEPWRASEMALSREGTYSQFTPLQLACQLGKRATFRHLLERRAQVEWRWGPLSQIRIELSGIDSVGGGANDVMEVIGRPEASAATQAFLLDAFLEGFLHKLFLEKWRKFGLTLHSGLRACELLYLLSLLTLTMWLKEWPESCLADGRWLAWSVLAASVPMIEEDVRSLVLMWRKMRTSILNEPRASAGAASRLFAGSDAENGAHGCGGAGGRAPAAGGDSDGVRRRSSLASDVRRLVRWSLDYQLPFKFSGCAVGCTVAASLLAGYRPYGVGELGSSGGVDPTTAPGVASADGIPLWSLLAFAVMAAFYVFFSGLLVPFQSIGVFFRTAFRVVFADVTIFLGLYAIFFCTFGLPTYIGYPRVGTHHVGYHP